MFVLIKNTITNEYSSIYRKDIKSFLNLKSFFGTEDFNFEIIEDRNEIKNILEDKFTSKGRGEEYNEDLPSVTKIAYTLFPISINNDKFLLRWKNNTPLLEQEGDKDNILSRGTFIHYILEQYVCDKESRQKDRPLIEKIKILNNCKKPSKKINKEINDKIISDIRRYIKMAYKDEEILRKISNIEDLKEELEFLAIKCLPDFIRNELIFTDLVYSEIFLCVDNNIQGSVDFVAVKDGEIHIIDYKTTSSVDKKTGKPKFKNSSQLAPFARQLYIYDKLLKETKMVNLLPNEYPEFNIIQIHLVSGKYKKFIIPQGLVEAQGKTIEKVLTWYWDIRNGMFDKYENECYNDCDDTEIDFLTI